ncbi:nuclear transport factor 2 family protein [Nocardia sp. NPDC003963]
MSGSPLPESDLAQRITLLETVETPEALKHRYFRAHGLHPDISVHADGTASGQWTLQFRQVNLLDRTDTLSTGEYDDSYVVEDGRWKIAASRFRRIWSITRPVDGTCRIGQYGA